MSKRFLNTILWALVPLMILNALIWNDIAPSGLEWHPFGQVHSKQSDSESKGSGLDTKHSARGMQVAMHADRSKTENDWDKVNGVTHLDNPEKNGQRSDKYKTFGWYPYWMGTAYQDINFKLLWGVSYFGYEVNPDDGSFLSIHSWNTTAMVDSAQKNHCKVYLSLMNLGSEPNHRLLSNESAKQNLIKTAIAQVANRKSNGLVVDFEDVMSDDKESFTQFLIDLGVALKKENEQYELIVTLYAVDENKVFDIEAINGTTAFYVMMGYEYSYAGSKNASANAPLQGSWANLESSVEFYLNQNLPKDKFIVALPYYGNEWTVENEQKGALTTGFVLSPIYSQMGHYDTAKAEFDLTTTSKYLSYQDEGGWRQVWYEDAETLGKKQEWIKSQKLAGVGIWALGYDNGSTTLWKVLERNFGKTN